MIARTPEPPIDADYIIVGGGTAGCVLANRLSADPSNKVLVLEVGGDDRPFHNIRQFRSNLNIGMPAGFTQILGDPHIDWAYLTDPDPNAAGRQYMIHRGKVLGGSSAINGMLYLRGQTQDYDGWRQLGCEGWGWADVLPYFRRAEHHEEGESALHGGDGPLSIAKPRHEDRITDALIQAWHEAGLPILDNLNSVDQEGVGFPAMTARRGARHSTAAAYLHPAMKRTNLRVETQAHVARVTFEGIRAAGVVFRQNGAERSAIARAEVILCGGAINSPQLLQLSGIGAAQHLAKLGISVMHDCALVGANLQDHFSAMMSFRMKDGSGGFNRLARGAALYRQLLRYAFMGRGLLTVAGAHAVAFARSRPEIDLPDLQFHLSPATVDSNRSAKAGHMVLEEAPGFTVAGYFMRPYSRGAVTIRSPDPLAAPSITHNFLSAPEDRAGTVAAMRWIRKVSAMPAMHPYLMHELAPTAAAESDEELIAVASASGNTSFHQAGSCAMGARPEDVLDPQLRVNGVRQLRVVDASVMPRLTSNNTNAPVIMIAEKAADMILSA